MNIGARPAGQEAMQPVRVIRSEEELRALAVGSLVCPPHAIFDPAQKTGADKFVPFTRQWYDEEDNTETTAEFWCQQQFIGSRFILEQDRALWVLFDAGGPQPAEPRSSTSRPEYLTRVPSRDPECQLHDTLEEAQAEIDRCLRDLPASEFMEIHIRWPSFIGFDHMFTIHRGDTRLPWN